MKRAAKKTTAGTTNSKNRGGRPTKLTRDLVNKAKKYIEVEVKLGGLHYGDLPTVAGLAVYMDVARSSIYKWAEEQKGQLGTEFSDTLERILATQQYYLEGKSLKGEYNPTIARMLLNVNHGMIEINKTDVTTGGEKITDPYDALTTAELKKLAKGK